MKHNKVINKVLFNSNIQHTEKLCYNKNRKRGDICLIY